MKHHSGKEDSGTGGDVRAIQVLSRTDLIKQWEMLFGAPPHKMISTRLLVRAVAHAAQVKHHGGLSKRRQQELSRFVRAEGGAAAQPLRNGQTSAAARIHVSGSKRPRAGARLIREWNGRSHVVEVLDKGFALQGQTYRSLSAIATAITGCRWSGPRFFGLSS